MNSTNMQNNQPTEWGKIIGSRRAPRFGPSAIPSLKSVHKVGGPEVKLINISRGGALIKTQESMSPGSSISLRLVTTGKVFLLKGQILRCNVYAIGKVIQYQCAIAFDKDFTILPPGKESD